jgi:Rho guanine nucleotide exchange factor 10
VEGTRRILNTIQSSIQQKDEEMAWVDSCCLQLAVKNKSNKEEIYTFQTDNPAVKKEWITGNEFVCSVVFCGLRIVTVGRK